MQEVFENIINKLEEQKEYYKDIRKNTHCRVTETSECDSCIADHFLDARLRCVDDIIEIVKHEAEKFGTDINVGSNGWISCNERLPEPIRPVLVTLRNWMNDKYFVRVGRFHTDHWKTDEGIVENSVVIAWQPLPQPYQPKGE